MLGDDLYHSCAQRYAHIHQQLACPGGAIGSVTVRTTWLRWPTRPGFKAQPGRITWVGFIAACALRWKSLAGTEGSTVSSLKLWLLADTGFSSGVGACWKVGGIGRRAKGRGYAPLQLGIWGLAPRNILLKSSFFCTEITQFWRDFCTFSPCECSQFLIVCILKVL